MIKGEMGKSELKTANLCDTEHLNNKMSGEKGKSMHMRKKTNIKYT